MNLMPRIPIRKSHVVATASSLDPHDAYQVYEPTNERYHDLSLQLLLLLLHLLYYVMILYLRYPQITFYDSRLSDTTTKPSPIGE
jgi:hypothetical protein